MKQPINKSSIVNHALLISFIICLILVPSFLEAKELVEQEVRAAVETWVRQVTADARPDAVIERMEPHDVNGKTVAYVAQLSGGGFCLCGADRPEFFLYIFTVRKEHMIL